jgi:thioredoxin 1
MSSMTIATPDNIDEIMKKDKAIFDIMSSEYCAPCKIMEPIIEEIALEHDEVEFIRVDIERCFEVASKFNVNAIPSIIFVNGGKEVDRLIGLQPKTVVEEHLQEFMEQD